ncbi:Molecular chaperones HSP70/HSC70, HSP70 superfamily [Pseudoloma neurophilia]|uniref:Molecular chaperones HSP70/HSC70, HSP70 superfamily n=1 Tax=Pseudoloma neurophilia TaxID=146866 RepID=A0A0R0LXZ0_9MICR|nr:Molecular chaperones HSP70/HSC70, HSP70 superfamily [Pseudoloma neurophilia]
MVEDNSKKSSKAIGIDLGTTYSCVCAYRNGELTVISNTEGHRITPSIVAFDEDGGRIIGTTAAHRLSTHPEKVVYDVKRLIGRGYDSTILASSIKKWPFKIVRWDHNKKGPTDIVAPSSTVDNIKIAIPKMDQNNNLTYMYHDPMEISSYILGNLKEAAEQVLGEKVTFAVITVPAHFNDNQKDKTRIAAQIAGFKEIRLLNEPTAAALSYAYDKSKRSEPQKEEKVLVFDLGGGTLDVSVVKFEPPTEGGSIAEVLNTDGDTFLGGVDFDNKMYEHCLQRFLQKNKKENLTEESIQHRAKRRLRTACEQAKRFLSTSNTAHVEVECFHGTLNLSETITRVMFDKMNELYFNQCMARVKGCLLGLKNIKVEYDDQKLLRPECLTGQNLTLLNEAKNEIDRVIVVGGSSRIIKLQEMLEEIFGKNKLDKSAHPDEAIARGAAYHAALVSGGTALDEECPMLLLDTVPLNISIETLGGVATTLIKKNTIRPCTKTEVFSTAADNQTSVTINIYEGLGSMVSSNNIIGSFNLTGIAPAKRGVPQIEVTCDVDNNGILVVSAKDRSSNKSEQLTVSNENRQTTPEQVEEMINKFKEYEKVDQEKREAVDAKNEYEQMLYGLSDQLEQMKPQFESQGRQNDYKDLDKTIKSHMDWIHSNPNASKADYENKKTELTELMKRFGGAAPPPHGGSEGFGHTTGSKVDEVD